MQEILDNIRIVLVETSHAGNLGSVARAMKTMGLSKLILVRPKAVIDSKAISMSSGADEILAAAQVVQDLSQAIAPCSLVMGASARSRRLDIACMSARDCVSAVKKYAKQPIALVFGPEHSGLSNEDLSLCHVHVFIPSVPAFSSLNLSQAVQVMCYELYVGLQDSVAPDNTVLQAHIEALAAAGDVDGVHQHFMEVMEQVAFLNPNQPRKLSQRIRRMLHRAELEQNEVNILRGFLATIQKHLV